ncbi:hypothetical protein MRV_0039 [Murid herpesvirus 3]|uniref:Uncharacterized protein n=2 Tax=Murid betaherpesvirus 3 TaxID=2560603 RepID=A0A1P8VIR7_9BETA|nr:hypothetical protein MRV_0039 [Murine roseolovirus]APZ76250.1 hypothetical protein MRV_0039 [Murid betaherpesvirus 3]AYH64782.1 hypothetical protein MRV_0039 [Murid herpesvirus 3]
MRFNFIWQIVIYIIILFDNDFLSVTGISVPTNSTIEANISVVTTNSIDYTSNFMRTTVGKNDSTNSMDSTTKNSNVSINNFTVTINASVVVKNISVRHSDNSSISYNNSTKFVTQTYINSIGVENATKKALNNTQDVNNETFTDHSNSYNSTEITTTFMDYDYSTIDEEKEIEKLEDIFNHLYSFPPYVIYVLIISIGLLALSCMFCFIYFLCIKRERAEIVVWDKKNVDFK